MAELSAPDTSDVVETCLNCEEGPFHTDGSDEDVETTWQQWRCPCCGFWNDRPA